MSYLHLKNSRSFRLTLLSLLVPLLTACAYTPEQAARISTQSLCRTYTNWGQENYLSPVIRNELIRRGETACVDPAYVNAVVNADAYARSSLFNAGAVMLQQGRPYTIPSNTCVQRYVGQNLVTQCY
jgi:hypothetical protein